MDELLECLKKAKRPDAFAMEEARRRWDAVAKPLRSLGLLEDAITSIAGAQGSANVATSPAAALIFCADNGVVCEGVSQSGSEVTQLVASSIAAGQSNINLMASRVGADVVCVDVGMNEEADDPRILVRKTRRGTGNIAEGPAMTRQDAEAAILVGIRLACGKRAQGYHILVTGEMGIGNTTTSCAAACALLGETPERLCGRGSGLSDAGLLRKKRAIERALAVNRPDPTDAIDVLQKVGGLDIAAMAGVFIGGSICGAPVIIDGAISAVAALCAARICPESKGFMLASHAGREPASSAAIEALGLKPVIHANLALGEGTGAALLLPMLDMAHAVYAGTHTFGSLGMDAYTEQN